MIDNSLEVQLMEKNKKLENEYTQVKVSFADLQKEHDQIKQKADSLEQQLDEKKSLVQKLEEDLLRMGQKNVAEPTILDDIPSRARTPDGARTPELKGKEDKSILPIVMSQRDRFRQRNAELEERTRSLETSLQDSRTEIQNLKADNLKLYERLKFVHVWKEGQQDKGLVVR